MELIAQFVIIGISIGAIYAIVAIGYNLVFGVMNVLNLAHGAIMMIGSYGVLLAFSMGIENFWVAAFFGLIVALAAGLLVDLVAIEPIKNSWWNVKVATLGCAMFLENFVTRLTAGRPEPYPRPFRPQYFELVGEIELSTVQLFLIVCSVTTMVLMLLFLRSTSIGKAIRVVAQSPDLARCVGVNVRFVMLFGLLLSALLAGIAGILNAVAFGSTYPYIGQLLGLKGLVILIVAGIGNVRGCVMVAMLLGITESVAVGLGGATVRDLVAYSTMVIVLLIRPQGLFGEEARIGREV